MLEASRRFSGTSSSLQRDVRFLQGVQENAGRLSG